MNRTPSPTSQPGPSRLPVVLGAGALVASLLLVAAVIGRPVAPGRSAVSASAAAHEDADLPPADAGAGAPSVGNEDADTTAAPVTPAQASDSGSPPGPLTATEIAARITPLETALDTPRPETSPRPVAISFPSIGVDASPIDGVGVEPNGELEVPGPLRVGWYEFGARPSGQGSTVLAAHIASGGVDGVFRHLADADIGDELSLALDDGTSARYQVVEIAQYDKDELPLGRVFAKRGEPVLTLITCGGAFQPSLRSYEDNVVAYAVPVGP